MSKIIALLGLSVMLSGCLFKTQYGLLTAGQVAEIEHTQGKTIVDNQPGSCRIKNIRAVEGNGALEIGINPLGLHIRGAKDNEAMQKCEILDLTCVECDFVPIAVLKIEDYQIKNIKYFTHNLIYKLVVLPDQIEYVKSALRTIKAQQ